MKIYHLTELIAWVCTAIAVVDAAMSPPPSTAGLIISVTMFVSVISLMAITGKLRAESE